VATQESKKKQLKNKRKEKATASIEEKLPFAVPARTGAKRGIK